MTRTIIILTCVALSSCDPPAAEITAANAPDRGDVRSGACHVGVVVKGDRVDMRVINDAGEHLASFAAGELESGADVVGSGATLERRVNTWCAATPGEGGLECVEALWSLGLCWQ